MSISSSEETQPTLASHSKHGRKLTRSYAMTDRSIYGGLADKVENYGQRSNTTGVKIEKVSIITALCAIYTPLNDLFY